MSQRDMPGNQSSMHVNQSSNVYNVQPLNQEQHGLQTTSIPVEY